MKSTAYEHSAPIYGALVEWAFDGSAAKATLPDGRSEEFKSAATADPNAHLQALLWAKNPPPEPKPAPEAKRGTE